MTAKNLQRLLMKIALLLVTPTVYAVEISHTVHTTLCTPAGKVIATCVTEHQVGGLMDTDVLTKLNFECEMKRLGVVVDKETQTFTDLADEGRYTGDVSSWTYGLGEIGYCATNKSKYMFYAGTFPGQHSAQDCVIYRKGPGPID